MVSINIRRLTRVSFVVLFAFASICAQEPHATLASAAVQSRTSEINLDFPEPHNVVMLSVPDQPAAIKIDLMRLKIIQSDLRQDLSGRRMMAEDSRGWVFSSFLFPREHAKNSTDLREWEWTDLQKGLAKNGLKPQQVKLYEKSGTAMLEYTIEEFRGQKVHQRNLFGYVVSGNLAIDFHISKVAFTPDDQKYLDTLLSGISLVENYEPDSKTEYGYGSAFYLEKNWKRAAAHYAKALETERKTRTLPTGEWRVLVDNLGMAYAFTGDLGKAKATFEYGVQEDGTYPMFHYNLACYYGETNDLDRVLEQLRVAFQYRNNGIPGEGMPDPSKDDSFKRYLKDPRFQALSKELCPRSTLSEGGWSCRQS